MEVKELQIGDKIEVEVIIGKERGSFAGEIIEVLNDNRVLISEIAHEGKSVGFSGTGPIYFLHMGDKINRWTALSIKLVKYKKEVYHCVTLAGNGEIYNRRESFRLYLGNECSLYIATSKGMERRDILLKDISTGGLSFILSDKEKGFTLHQKVRISLQDGAYDLNLHVEIIRTVPLEGRNATLYGCRFATPNPSVGRYITQKQSKKLQERRASHY